MISQETNKKRESFLIYVIKRFKRLIIPAWIFSTFFLFIMAILNLTVHINYELNLTRIIGTYSMIRGIGYVWIIRVFFTIAILSPLLSSIARHIKKMTYKLFFLVFLLFINQFLTVVTNNLSHNTSIVFDQLVAIPFAYSIMALLGMWAVKQTKTENLFMGSISIVIFLVFGFFMNFPNLSDQKYPPTFYFLLYGAGVSLILLSFLTNNKIELSLSKIPTIKWLSQYSLEFYYWHILPVTLMRIYIPDYPWYFKFILALVTAALFTTLQIKYLPNFFKPEIKFFKKQTTAN